jgi:Tfp pilus assembly protein FimT
VKRGIATISRRRAFTVTELLGVIGLMSVLLFLSARLFHTSVRYSHQTAEAASDANRLDSIVTKLRSDAWTATSATASGAELSLTQSGEQIAKWNVAADGTLTRNLQQGEQILEQQRWPLIAKGWAFSVSDPEITLKDPIAGELRLVMQIKLLDKSK